MKNTKKNILLVSLLALGLSLSNCGSDSDDKTEDTSEKKELEKSETVTKTDSDEKKEEQPIITEEENPTPEEPEIIVYEQEVKSDGTIVIQAESANLVSDWKKRSDASGFNGDGYIVWEGSNKFWGNGSPGKNGLLSYAVEIEKTGTYQFVWTSRIIKEDPEKPTTEHNDSWIRIPDSDDFYAFDSVNMDKYYATGNLKGKTPVIPISFLNPNPNNLPKGGENGNGFFKGYMNTFGSWKQTVKTWDHKGMLLYATFNAPGTYTVEIDARSDGHGIDQFSLIPQ